MSSEEPTVERRSRSLSVLIISYNTGELLDACLTSLRPQIGPDREVVVLDNASPDGSADLVEVRHGWVRLVRSETNLGFAAGCNAAARVAAGDAILLLNPDTEVHPGALDAICDFARRRPDGVLYGGRTVGPDGELDPRSCWAEPTVWSTACFALGLSTLFPGNRWLDPEAIGGWRRDTEREVGVVTGCLLLVSRDWWDRLGGFDERYFMYGEDVDLSIRARRAGGRPMITPRATVTHVVGAASVRSDKLVMLLNGKVTLARRYFGVVGGRAAVLLLLFGIWLRGWAWPALSRRPSGWSSAWRRRAEWRRGY